MALAFIDVKPCTGDRRELKRSGARSNYSIVIEGGRTGYLGVWDNFYRKRFFQPEELRWMREIK